MALLSCGHRNVHQKDLQLNVACRKFLRRKSDFVAGTTWMQRENTKSNVVKTDSETFANQYEAAKNSRVESSLYAKKMAGPIGHRREKEMKREQIAKFIHEI